MSTEQRTITLPTLDHGDVTIPEPSWCRGHADHHPDSYRTDLTHYGPEHRLTFNGGPLFVLMLAQSPLSERAGREVCAYVEESGFTGSLDPADQMRAFADELAAILAGGESR